jgi:hypothetical protein
MSRHKPMLVMFELRTRRSLVQRAIQSVILFPFKPIELGHHGADADAVQVRSITTVSDA